uniref:ABC-2 type transporter transmembrane domain-containing protein n=1 Tax=Equus asinus TaxID=9793 RepID=A0A9L0J705_EQUAS
MDEELSGTRPAVGVGRRARHPGVWPRSRGAGQRGLRGPEAGLGSPQKRKTLVTVLEILMPLLFSTIVMYLRFASLPRKYPATNYRAVDVTSLPEFFHHFPVENKFQLIYIPSQSETLKTIIEMVEQAFDVEFEVLGYSSVPSFERFIIEDPKAFYALAGIVFDHSFSDSKEPLPLEVKYYLRFSSIQRNFQVSMAIFQDDVKGWSTSFLYPPNPSPEPRNFDYSDGGSPGYNKEGFLAIQHAVDKAIMQYHAHNVMTKMFENLSVLVKRFPHGAYVQDNFFLVLQNEFPLFLLLSFICSELIIINSIVLEKERKLKEYMCTMGLVNWQHWVAWFIIFFISAFIVVSFMTILFCTKPTLQLPQEASSSSSPISPTCTLLSPTPRGATSKRLPFVSSQMLPWHWESD